MSRQNPRSCQDIQDSRFYQDFQVPRSCQDIRDEIQDLTKKFKMSRQNLKSFQDIQEFKIFLRSWQDIQDVERWDGFFTSLKVGHLQGLPVVNYVAPLCTGI